MELFFIGAGPGDPELLTIKGKNIIEKADIIIYAGSLVNKAILKFSKSESIHFDSAKMDFEEILEIIKKNINTKKIIARIHSGDPCIYGATQEQMDWCDKNNINYTVIPGVSSFQASAASLKQEFTLPDVTQTIILTRISGKTDVPDKEDLAKLSKIRATMSIFLSILEIDRVMKKLKEGYKSDTPVAVVERVTYENERKIFGTLDDIAEKVKKAGIKKQALIIVGEVLNKKYKKSKLYDKTFSHGYRDKKE